MAPLALPLVQRSRGGPANRRPARIANLPAETPYLSRLVRLLPIPRAGSAEPARAAFPGLIERPGFDLEILSGHHAGARIALPGPTCVIGSASECDVVLSDEAVAARHLRIQLAGWKAAIEALEGPVARDGESAVEPGYGYRAELPLELTIGDSRMRVSRPVASRRPLKPLFVGTAAFAALTLGVMILARAFTPEPDAERTPTARFADRTGATAASRAVDQLRARIERAGLSTLSVGVKDGRIEVTGQVQAAEMLSAWQGIEKWFDAAHGGKFILVSRVETSGPGNTPQIRLQAVWLGADPYIVDGRGERRYPGEALDNGWTLRSIAADRVTVTRDGQDVAIAL